MEKSLFIKERGVHPLANVSLEERVSYLKAISVFVALEDESREKFTNIINLLECEDVKEDLFAFLTSQTQEERVEIFESLEDDLRLKIAMDITYTFKADITEVEDYFVVDLLRVSRAVLSLLYKLVLSIKSGDSDRVNETYLKVLKFEGLYEVVGEFASVYGFEYEHSLQDVTDDFMFAGKNKHKERFQPKYMDTLSISANEEIILYIVRVNGMALEYATSREIEGNETISLAAVRNNGMALQYASSEIKENKTICLAAVKNNGMAFQYASNAMKKNKKICLAAVKQNKYAKKYVLDSLKHDQDILLALQA